MNFLVTLFHLITSAVCVSCTLHQDAFSISDGQEMMSPDASQNEFIASSQVTAIKHIRSFNPQIYGSLATDLYLFVAFFYDQSSTACNNIFGAVAYQSNVCIPNGLRKSGSTEYFTITLMPNEAVDTLFSDESCMTKSSESVIEFQKTCLNNSMIYTGSSITLPYGAAHVEARLQISCDADPVIVEYYLFNVCYSSSMYSVTGSTITLKTYADVNCANETFTTETATSGDCVASRGAPFTTYVAIAAKDVKSPTMLPVAAVPTLTPPTVTKPTSPSAPTDRTPTVSVPSPSQAPVPAIAQATSTSGSKTASTCFAGSERVALESGSSKFISDVLVGDRVLVADAAGVTSFSPVVFIPHGANRQRAIFTHITTHSGRDIKMTQNHVLPAGTCSLSTSHQTQSPSALLPLVYASQVSVGDCIMTVAGQEKVSAVEKVHSEGVYTIVTNQEYLVVNGIIASPFGVNHMMANMYYNIHRMVYASAPMLLSYPWLNRANEALGLFTPLFGLSN